MEITLPEPSQSHVQTGSLLGLDPSFLGFSPYLNINSINWIEATLIEEIQTSLEDQSPLDDLSDQDLGLAALLDSPDFPVIKAPHKKMLNFGCDIVSQSQPVCNILDELLNLEEVGTSQPDSPSPRNLQSAVTTLKGSPYLLNFPLLSQ